MIAAASQKKAQYDYLILSFALSDTEIPVWESLFWQNKAVLSANIYSMIANEMPALEEAASRRQPRAKNLLPQAIPPAVAGVPACDQFCPA